MTSAALALALLLLSTGCASSTSGAARPSAPEAPASTSPTTAAASVPAVLAKACGQPGTVVVLTEVPVTVRHRDCDLTGVVVKVGDNGTSAVVPGPGQTVGGVGDAPAGVPAPAAITITVDLDGDVTIDDSV